MDANTSTQAATYNIHAYPTHLIDTITLREGQRATLRPVLPQDAPLEQRFVANLSHSSRFNRFHGNLNGLSESFVEHITCIDYVHQMGFVITTQENDREIVIADACYVLSDDGDTAEFALAVSDGWQGQGLGSQLVDALCAAARRVGARWLYGEVLADNACMLALMVRCGFTVRPHPGDDSLVRVERSVAGTSTRRAAPHAGPFFAALNHALPRWLHRRHHGHTSRINRPFRPQPAMSERSYQRQLLGPFI